MGPAKTKDGVLWECPPSTFSEEDKLTIPKFMCYYKLGDTIPYYIETMGWENTYGRLKERILETRGKRGTASDLHGVIDISMYKIYPPGRQEETGDPLHPELTDMDEEILTYSSMEDPIIVPAIRDDRADAVNAKNVQEMVKRRMLAKKKRKEDAKKAAEAAAPPPPPRKEEAITTIHIRTPDAKTVLVKIKPTDSIQSIKEKIVPETGVGVPEQILTFNGKELPDSEMADATGLKDGSVVDLEPNTMTVQVKTPDGKTILVIIKPTDYIESIKAKIADEVGVKVPKQVLTFNGKELPNVETAATMGLKEGCVIDVQQISIAVLVKTPDGKTIPVTIKPSDNIESIKEKIAEEVEIEVLDQVLTFNSKDLPNIESADAMGLKDGSIVDLQQNTITVQVKTPDGKTIPVKMKPADDMLSIKENIASEAGVEVTDQVLTFGGKELTDPASADAMGLNDGSIVDLQPTTITVQVKTTDGKSIPVNIKPADNIKSIKEKIAEEVEVEIPQQILTFGGKVLTNPESAGAVGLKDGSIIDLLPNYFTIQAKTSDGKTIPVQIKPSDNIESIKEKIAEEASVEVPEQVLTFNENELPNQESAYPMGLKDGSIINLLPNTITVQVKIPDRKTLPVQMKSADNIVSIKEKIADEAGMVVLEQVLTFHDKELSNTESADAMGLKDGSVINLQPTTITVQVKTPSKTIPVQIKPADSIESIKEIIASESGVEVPDQVLTFNGEELPNLESAGAVGLKDGSVIDLQSNTMEEELGEGTMKVFVKTPEKKTIGVEVKLSDTIQSIKVKIASKTGLEAPEQVLKFNSKRLPNPATLEELGIKDRSTLDLKKDKNKKSKKKKSDDSDWMEEERKKYGHDFTPSPFDLGRFKAHFMIGDQVPIEMICPIAMNIKGFKIEILKLKNDTSFVKSYFAGLNDPDKLIIYPAGSYGEGDPLPDDFPVPKNSSPYAHFSV